VVLAEVVRNRFVESGHHGSIAVTRPDGSVEWFAGEVQRAMFPRSANKPMQVLGMLRAGVPLDGALLALAGASHSGEAFHVSGVREILRMAGLDEAALRNPRRYPVDGRARDQWVRATACARPGCHELLGQARGHAAHLRGQRLAYRGLPGSRPPGAAADPRRGGRGGRAGRRGRGGRVRRAVGGAQPRPAGPRVRPFASAAPGTLEARVAGAYRDHPEYVSGSRRLSARLMASVPGLVCKTGAEGVFAAGLPDGRGLAMKVDDGGGRARPVVLAAALRRMGLDNEVIRARGDRPVLGGAVRVGHIRPGPALVR
jgi:L-asparaginase II